MRPIYCYYGPGPPGFANAGQQLYHRANPQPRRSIFNINEKRKIFQSSVIPKFWTIYRTLIVLLRIQNVFLTSLDSSVKVYKV